jgi:hypothetical protein
LQPFFDRPGKGKIMNYVDEKRKFNRFDFQKTVQVFPVLPSSSGNIFEVQKKPIEAWANDISEGGLRLEAADSFDPNFLLKLNLELVEDQSVEVYGKIIWSRDSHCGVRFMLVDKKLRKGIHAISAKKNSPSE